MQSQIPRLDSLTGMRFFAAFYVVLYHCYLYLFPQLEFAFGIGFAGVSFFFVLSGFVLAWSHRPDGKPRDFYVRRFARIYPLHVLTTALALALYLITDAPVPWGSLLPVLLLVHAWSPYWRYDFNGVSWSLSAEAFFYALFPLVINRWFGISVATLRRRGYIIAASAIAIAIVVLTLLPPYTWNALTYTNPGFRVAEFLIGVLLGLGFRAGWRPRLSGLATIAPLLTGVVILYVLELTKLVPVFARSLHGIDSLVLLPGFVVLVIAFAERDIACRPSIFRSSILRKLGEWSFALYLIHELVLRLVGVIHPNVDLGRVWLTFAGVAVSVALSGFLYHAFERPVEKRVRLALKVQERPQSA